MINTMLLISRTEAGVDEFSTEEIDITDLIRDACELFEPIAEDKGVSLSCGVSDGCAVFGDTRMIQRMFANLLDNAIRYTPPGGAVSVSVQGDKRPHVAVSVRDTGVGISPDDLPHIFERFYRCDQSRSQAGIGLGLSLARAVAQAHGGDITVTSSPNEGSTFTVRLPKSPPPLSQPPPVTPPLVSG
jgi:signal transduction histidine kinase